MCVTEQESRADIIDGDRRAWQYADGTIDALPVDEQSDGVVGAGPVTASEHDDAD